MPIATMGRPGELGKMYIETTILFLVLAIIASTIRADSWARPTTKRVTSADKLWEFTAEPPKSSPLSGKSTGTLISAKDKSVVWRAPLVCIPVFIEAYTVDGKPYVVTRDRWHRVGYDHCLVIYGPDGKVVKDYKLEDLLTEREILRHVTHSVSSRWWNEGTKYEFVKGGKYRMRFKWGKEVVVDLRTGKILGELKIGR
jgi:hypothetical protein